MKTEQFITADERMKKKKKKRIGSVIIDVCIAVLIGGGICFLTYPSFSDWWNQMHQTRAVASYIEKVADLSKQDDERMWKEAEQYNQDLLKNDHRFQPTRKEEARYRSILDVTGTGIMGYISIPSIHIELPVYHGTDEGVLEIAIGHLEGTSLPVGGTGTHCVVSGHTGLPSARLFTDISELKKGDIFTFSVLDRTLTYEVYQISVVLPEDLDDIAIDPVQDYCTLVTCTPYGVNTHRLLVRGHRIPTIPDDTGITADAVKIEPIYVIPFLSVLLAAVVAFDLLTARRRPRRKKTQKAG